MNRNLQYINNRLKLRNPQRESLEILDDILNDINLEKNIDLSETLKSISEKYPTITDFEHEFPSICFALATGVGKTRLMGAFIAYLYKEKNIKNFFILAPNLPVYSKLIKDFSDNNSSKYVFKGLSDFVKTPPTIVTGDNYEELSLYMHNLGSSEIIINIFNIDKINAETKGGKQPRIKRLSEYIGKSYFEYLVSKPDLVLLMDESHHYRADRGMKVINELNPVLGIEVTATPQVESGTKTIKFKNVVYEYSLARAIKDGFVKEPAVATRRDFDTKQYNDEELDKIKILDGIKIHIETQVEVEKYARDNGRQIVKPFVLIVAKDTNHSKSILSFIQSQECYEGYYADKVIEIHSKQNGSEKEENIEKLVSLEKEDNIVEIVIHVNMLKEGWDVNNLYAIIPLRASASNTLTVQTIGRGLRLPYGERTNNTKVDRLTIVSHDNYKKIIDEANKETSIIRKENIIEVEAEETIKPKEVVTSCSKIEEIIFGSDINRRIENNSIEDAQNEYGSFVKKVKLEVYKMALDLNKKVKNINELKNKEIKDIVISSVKSSIKQKSDGFGCEVINTVKIEEIFDEIIESIVTNTIAIPRVTVQQTLDIKWGFNNFDLNTKNLNYQPTDETIIIKDLRNGNVEIIDSIKNTKEVDSLENIILRELIVYPEIDYDLFSELMYKLIKQAIDKFKSYLDEEKVAIVIMERKRDIANFIYTQMKEEFYYEVPTFDVGQVMPYTKIEPNNLTKYIGDKIYSFRDTVEPKSDIPKKIFGGFKKSCHSLYKFDSNTEKLFSILLEDDKTVLKWLRPATKQFYMYWDRDKEHLYEPDFIVETENIIYMVETKASSEIKRANENSNDEISLKANAAIKYCEKVSKFNLNNSGKEWKYVLVPHNIIENGNSSFKYIVSLYEYNK